MHNHVVEPGECLATIAEQYGLLKWQTIYDAPQNADFRKKRPNRTSFYPGDVIVIPDKKDRSETASTERNTSFQITEQSG
jgi:N-acetylmuramoyl-L-alanine amidase